MGEECNNEACTGFITGNHTENKEGSTYCGDCLNIKKAFSSSPKIVVWTAVEEVAKLHKTKSKKKKLDKKKEKGFLVILLLGTILFILGICSLIWTPFEIVMKERLKMVRGFPAFEWWKNPPDEVLLRMYVFNITNSKEFMIGTDRNLKIQELGPYVFREKLRHKNIRFNDNGTMTYTAVREAIFLPEMNTLSLNETIVVPNLAVLGISSYLWNANFIFRTGFNLVLNGRNSQPLVSTTVYNYFWNFSDPIMDVAISMAPHLVPEKNMGVLHQIYRDFVDEITVYIGVENGDYKFFKIDKFHGRNGLGAWKNETCDSVQGSTEGVHYHQELKRSDKVIYLRKTICRATPLFYTRDEENLGMNGYRFDLPNDTFSKPPKASEGEDCFHKNGLPPLPSGLTDVSPCYYDFPIASSFPHFMHSEPSVYTDRISGLQPDQEKHGSFVVIEPITGVPFHSRARSQSSLIVRPMSNFPKLRKFSEMAIPMFWAEYNQVGLPWYVASLMYFTAIILPAAQTYGSIIVILSSAIILLVSFHRINKRFILKSSVSYSNIAQNVNPIVK